MGLATLLIILELCLSRLSYTTGCDSPSRDIMFLFDTSDAIRSRSFDSEKMFLGYMVDHLMDSSDNIRIGIATFTDTVHIQILMNQYLSKSMYLEDIKDMWYSIGMADLGTSLSALLEIGFNNLAGSRPGNMDAIIVVTHVAVSDGQLADRIKRQLANYHTEIYIISVGSFYTLSQFTLLTSSERVLNIKNVSELLMARDYLLSVLCKGSGKGILGQWGQWSACGVTCGQGFQERYRNCTKYHADDADCDGLMVDRQRCKEEDCRVDGQWSFWSYWSKCSVSCGGGEQTRIRECNNPMPKNGGNQCPGEIRQNRSCSNWNCPDCLRVCLPGSHLSKPKCDVCICTNTRVFGTVVDEMKIPIEGARIYLRSKLYEPTAITDDWGRYQIFDVCMVGETLEAHKEGFSRVQVAAEYLNNSHFQAIFTLNHLVPPVFVIHPKSKHRFAGQSVTLCCQALGDPKPTNYKWFKDNIEIETQGSNGTLRLTSLQMSDAGSYRCSVETEAGISLSNEAKLSVEADGTHDSCSGPSSRIVDLPPTCFVANNDGTKSSTIDIGTCSNRPCILLDLFDNGTCSEWWPRHCCDVQSFDYIDVLCDGFSYIINKVRSCQCQLCIRKATIRGMVKGMINDSEAPVRLAGLYIYGKKVGITNMQGYFNFEVPEDTPRIVLTIQDERFKQFSTVTKIFYIDEGVSSSVTIYMKVRSKPVLINTAIGGNIPLGSTNLPPAAIVSIPPDSIITADGKPFHGTAHTEINFIDPRKIEDIQCSNGEFVTENQNGNANPLETFGMFDFSVSDGHGQILRMKNQLNISLDPALFNISTNIDGDPDIAIWGYDKNKGIWFKVSDMKFSSPRSGSNRRLLDTMVEASFTLPNIPPIEVRQLVNKTVTENSTQRVTGPGIDETGKYVINLDRIMTIQINVTTRDYVIKDGACLLSATMYGDLNLREPLPGANVVAATKDRFNDRFQGYDRQTSDSQGHVCLKIFCDSIIYLYAEHASVNERLFVSLTTDNLPPNFDFKTKDNGTLVELEAQNRGWIEIDGNRRYSPVLDYDEDGRDLCTNHHQENYKFQFAPATKEPTLSAITNDNDKKLSWYPIAVDKPGRRACFIKVLVKIPNFDSRIIATSYQNTSTPENAYGTYNVGPIFDPTSGNRDIKAACVEFRCPGLVKDKNNNLFDVPTIVNVSIGTTQRCRFSIKSNRLTTVIPAAGGKQFIFHAEAGFNYGPIFGVYENNGDSEKIRHFCMSGTDSGYVGNIMKPNINPAVEFDCM